MRYRRYKHYEKSRRTIITSILTGHAARRTACGVLRGLGRLTPDPLKVTCPKCLKTM